MDRLPASPALESRSDSMVSLATNTSWLSESSSRPTSFGSDALPSSFAKQTEGSQPHPKSLKPSDLSSMAFPVLTDRSRRPGHALMRLRRISMPATPSPHSEISSASSAHTRNSPASLVPHHRASLASACSCASLPEEAAESTFENADAALESRPSEILQSAIPLPARRIRLKSTRRQSTPSSVSRDGPTHRDDSAGSRPVSIALPTTSALVATSTKGQACARESQTLKRSLTSNNGVLAPTSSPGKDKSSVTFSLAMPTRSIISAQDFNTAKKNARMAKKDRISNEILQSERVYVAILHVIQEHFIEPLSAPSSASKAEASGPLAPSAIFPPKTVKAIFSNFSDVYNLNREILRRLEENVSSAPPSSSQPATSPALAAPQFTGAPSPPTASASIRAYSPTTLPVPRMIGSTLAPVLPFLKCYSLFVGNFGKAQAILNREERTNPAWKAYLDSKREQNVGKGLSLTAMLLCIVQRIPRYRLLLGDLFRFTNQSDPDYKPLRRAILAVEEVAQHLEESIKQYESSVAMLELQKSFIGLDFQLIAPGRRFIKSGVLVKQGRRADEEQAFFLFTDILVYADVVHAWTLPGLGSSAVYEPSPSMGSDKLPVSALWTVPALSGANTECAQYIFKQRLELEDLTVTAAVGQAFEVRSSVHSFCLVAATPESKHEWVEALREAKGDLLQARRTLLTEEEEKKRSRLRRLSMPIPPPLSDRAIPAPPLISSHSHVTPSTAASATSSPTRSSFTRNITWPEEVNDDNGSTASQLRFEHGHAVEHSQETTASSNRSSYSSHAKYQNFKVYEDYSAPIWIPDSRTAKCMKCGEPFALWRRRHHCRLCGDVVCWSCSTKSFAIPSANGQGAHVIGRACDDCYQTCFVHTPDAERPDPLGHCIRSSEFSYSLLGGVNPLRPLVAKAASLYGLASNATRSREGSLEGKSPSHSRRSSQDTYNTPGSEALLKSVLNG